MALTFTAQTSEGGATAVAAIVTTLLNSGTGLFVAAYMDGEGRCHTFIPSAIAQATASDAVSKWFPQVGQLTAVVSSPGTSDNTGPVKLYLTPGTSDVINSASPQYVVLDRWCVITTVTGTV